MRFIIHMFLRLFKPTPQQRFRKALIAAAVSQLGLGEEGSNNKGQHVAKYAAAAHMSAPILWCAAFVSWCYVEACARVTATPAKIMRVNAKRLAKAVLAQGGAAIHDTEVLPGDFVVFNRGHKPQQGHIGIVTRVDHAEGTFVSIEGNKGTFPSKVRTFNHEFGEPDIHSFVRVKELV